MSPCPSRRRAHAGATQHAFGFDIRDFVKIGDAARADLPVTEHLQLWVFAVATFMRQQASEPEAHRRVNSLERALNVGLQALRAHFVRHRQKLKNPANVVEGSPEHERLGSQVFFGGKKFGKLHRIPPPPDAYPGVVVSDWRQLFTWLSGPCLGALPDLPQRQFAPAAGTSKTGAAPDKDNQCCAFTSGTCTSPANRCKWVHEIPLSAPSARLGSGEGGAGGSDGGNGGGGGGGKRKKGHGLCSASEPTSTRTRAPAKEGVARAAPRVAPGAQIGAVPWPGGGGNHFRGLGVQLIESSAATSTQANNATGFRSWNSFCMMKGKALRGLTQTQACATGYTSR